jgi:hypothetical protein
VVLLVIREDWGPVMVSKELDFFNRWNTASIASMVSLSNVRFLWLKWVMWSATLFRPCVCRKLLFSGFDGFPDGFTVRILSLQQTNWHSQYICSSVKIERRLDKRPSGYVHPRKFQVDSRILRWLDSPRTSVRPPSVIEGSGWRDPARMPGSSLLESDALAAI